MALAGTVLGLVLLVMGLAVAFLTGVGGPLSVGDLLVLVVALVTVAVFWSWLGVGIGLLVTNQTVAVLVPVLWLVVVEPLVGSSGLPGVLPWLPASLPGQVLPSSPGGPGPALAVVLLAAYGLALSVPGTVRLVRRDLT
jgi:hypothetical protein